MRQLFAALVACLAGTLGAQVTFTATPNVAIPDNSPNGVTSTISIPATADRIRSLRVGVRIAHTYDADLDIWLIPPGVAWAGPYTSINNGPVAEPPAGVIQLSTNNGGSGNNYGSTTSTTTFANFSSLADPTWPATQSIVSGAAPFTAQAQWQPEWQDVWNTLYGKDPTGDWTLAVADGWALDTGTLLSWRIEYVPLASPSLVVRAGDSNNPGAPGVPGQTGQVLGQAWVEAVGANAISGVTVTAQNGVTISGSLSQLALYLDVNADGALDPGDTFVQAATLAGSAANFNFGSSIPLASGATAALLLAGDVLPSPAASGVTLQITNAAAVAGAANVYGVFPVAFGFHPFASLRTFTSVPAGGKEIPNAQQFGVRDTITIPPTDDRIASVRVGVRLDHDRLQDVEMWLLPPGIDWSGPYTGAGPAGVVELSTDNGGNGGNLGAGSGPFVYTLFCSQSDPNLAWRANRSIQLGQSEAPFTYRPAYYPEDQADFDALYGADPTGQWTLVVADDNGGGGNNGGRLWSWQVEYLAHPKAALSGNPDHGTATVGLPNPAPPNAFSIANGGDYPLAVTGISFVGGNPADFSHDVPAFPISVAAGGSANFGVTFTPSGSGVRNTTLRITSNSGGVAGSVHDMIIWGFGEMPNQLVINPGFNNQPGEAFKFGVTNAVFGQYEFAAGTVAGTVTSVTFSEEANRVLASNLANLRLYHDVDNDGELTAADTLIGTTTLGPGASSATFNVNRNIGAQSFENWILVGNVAALPTDTLLAFEIRSAGDLVSTPSALAVYPVATGPHPLESTRIFTSTPAGGLAIPNNSTTGVTDSIVIPPTTETVAALRVGVRIDHPNDADLEMWLIPPGITWNGPYGGNGPAGVILLSSDNGGTGDDYGSGTAPFVYANFTHQNDPRFTPSVNIAGQGAGAAPFTGTYYGPEDAGDFLALYGISPAGTWTLAVRDDAGNSFSSGFLVSWQIEYLPPATPAVTGLNDWGGSNVNIASPLNPQPYSITNVGGTSLSIASITLVGANANDWAFAGATGVPVSMPPGASHNVSLNFTPAAQGVRNAFLRVTYDDGLQTGLVLDYSLTGRGTRGLIGAATPVDYGSGGVGLPSSNSPVTHTITNNGDGPLTLSAIALAGVDAADWSILSSPALPAVIEPSASVNIQARLIPGAVGARNAMLRVTSDTGALPGTFTDVALTGLGTTGVLSTPLGPVDYGQSNPGTVTSLSPVAHLVSNTGDGPLTITAIAVVGANPGDWTILSSPALPAVISPAGSVIVQLQCTPTATGSRVAVLRLTSDSGATPNHVTQVVLVATGTQGQIATAPGPVDYGSGPIGSPSANSPLTHTISNTGNGPLTIFAISVQGADASDWTLIGAPGSYPVVIPVSGSLLFDGQLVPSGEGPRNATLRIESDSLANPASVTNVALEGLGLPLTTVTGVTVGADIGGPLAVTATVNGPPTSFIDVTVTYSGGINAGPPVISNAGGLTIAGNVIQNVPANSTIQFLWDAYATERHTTTSDYVITLTPSQASLAGTPGSSAPFTLQRNGGWAQHVAPGESPRGVYSHTMIYDAANDRAVVFGGRDTGNKLNSVWVLERSGAPYLGWRQLQPTGAPPAGRQYANAIYDAANQRMVLFGGLIDAGPTNDTWELTLTPGSETWNQIAIPSPATPSPRRSAGFVYDALRGRAVLFGGLGAAQSNDTWELNLSSDTWSQMTPAGTPPSARLGHACALDAVGDRMIVFGGRSGSTDTADLYELSLAGSGTWGQLVPTGSPSARYFSTHTWDGTNRALVVQSGYAGTVAQRDAWYLDMSGAPAWTQLTPDANAGTGRVVGGAVWDGSRDEVLFYGGTSGSTLTSPIVSVLDVSGAPTWDTPTGDISTSPEGRWGGVMAWDHVNDRVIVWGGKDSSAYFGDVWVLDQSTPNGEWSRLPVSGPRPEPRTYSAYAVDTVNDRLIIHGGGIPAGPVVDELWTLDLVSGAWTQWPTAGGPTPRDQHTLVYDNLRNRAVIFGGRVPGVTNEVWAYDFGTASWAQITPEAPLAPARHGHGASYDSVNDRMVIFAGRAPTGRRNDVWTLSLSPGTEAWTDASAVSPVPTPRHYFGFAANAAGTRMWMHAGDTGTPSAELWELDMTAATAAWTQVVINGSAPLERYLGSACMSPAGQLYAGFGFLDNRGGADLWRIDTAATANGWTQVGTTAPDSLVSAAQAFDPVGRRLIAFGGLGGGVHQTGLWQLDLASPVAQWTQLDATGPGPSARRSASMVYDSSTSTPRMLMFGGRTGFAHSSIVDELWALELSPGNEQWVQLTPTGTPGRRTNHAAVIDGSNRMIVYGGIDQNGGNLGTVFALDIATLTWSQITPTGTAPSPRFSMIMEYDAPRNRIIIHGGNQGGVTPIGNSFVLDLTGTPSWSSYVTTGTGPGPLYYASSVIDAANQRMLVFGGHSTSPQSRLFELDLATDTWTEISGTVAQPQARWSHSACWDSIGNRMVIAGGYLLGEVAATQEGGSVAETWFWGD